MKLLVGLGNPGAKYQNNRHNIGFMAVDRIAADHGFGPWKKGFQGLVAEGRIAGEKVILLKPETFMNLSGQAVQAAVAFHKVPLADVVVLHDELDLAPGKFRLKQGGGHAGHNGLRSIHGHLGDGYARLRLGIGHPGHKDLVAHYVLQDFAKADQAWLAPLLAGITAGAAALIAGDGGAFGTAVAQAGSAPKPKPKPDTNAAGPETVIKPQVQTPDAPLAADPRSPMQKLLDRFR
ncbi:MAG: aminoacyl-tRNA hydrolase [Rhodobacteraceae bacterium]|jgi:PTH1 family peptidyl-tRNA hydrolase|nr:aminoacyl-tRNA hydrolase [Paracoccaceae bacterium]